MGTAPIDQKKVALFYGISNSVDKMKGRAGGIINKFDIRVGVVGTAFPCIYPMYSIVPDEIKPILFFIKYRV